MATGWPPRVAGSTRSMPRQERCRAEPRPGSVRSDQHEREHVADDSIALHHAAQYRLCRSRRSRSRASGCVRSREPNASSRGSRTSECARPRRRPRGAATRRLGVLDRSTCWPDSVTTYALPCRVEPARSRTPGAASSGSSDPGAEPRAVFRWDDQPRNSDCRRANSGSDRTSLRGLVQLDRHHAAARDARGCFADLAMAP